MLERSRHPSLLFWRVAGLVSLLVVEVLGISVRFDAGNIPASRPLHDLVDGTCMVARIVLAIGLATLLIAGPGWYKELASSKARLPRRPVLSPALFANLAAFTGFYFLSTAVLEGEGTGYATEWGLFLAWIISASATLIFWGLALLPGALWISLVRVSPGYLVAGPALGATAYGVALLARGRFTSLQRATLRVVDGLLRVACSQTVYQPDENVVGTSAFQVQIAPACSGYEGVILIAALLSVSLWMFRRDLRFPRALTLLPLGIVLIWLANSVRIFALVILGTCGYPELAVSGFHSLAGWFLLLVIGLGLITAARRMSFFSTAQRERRSKSTNPAAAYLLPAMAIIATAMATTAFSPGFDRYYPARVIIALVVLVCFRRSYSELRMKWSWEAVATGCGVFAFWILLEQRGVKQTGGTAVLSGLQSLSAGGATVWLVFRVVGSVITVPLAEELAFRGYLTRRLVSTDFKAITPGRLSCWTLLISSLLFGVLHGRWIAGTLAGIAYGLVYYRRGELADSVLAHGVTNALIAVAVLVAGDWSFWS